MFVGQPPSEVDLVQRLSQNLEVKSVNVHEAKTHLSRLLERAHSGEEILIAKGGKPYARLVPLATGPAKREAGSLKGKVTVSGEFFESLPSGWSGED